MQDRQGLRQFQICKDNGGKAREKLPPRLHKHSIQILKSHTNTRRLSVLSYSQSLEEQVWGKCLPLIQRCCSSVLVQALQGSRTHSWWSMPVSTRTLLPILELSRWSVGLCNWSKLWVLGTVLTSYSCVTQPVCFGLIHKCVYFLVLTGVRVFDHFYYIYNLDIKLQKK